MYTTFPFGDRSRWCPLLVRSCVHPWRSAARINFEKLLLDDLELLICRGIPADPS